MFKIILHDNKLNRQQLLLSKLSESKSLEYYGFLKLVNNENDLFNSIKVLIENSELEESKTIIMHDSDFDNDPIDKIIDLCKTNRIDLVLFTGGNTTKKLRMKEIPKARLSAEHVYSENLFYFLDHFETDYKLEYLVFGKDFILNQLLNFRLFLNLKLKQEVNNPNDIYDYLRDRVDVDYLIEYLKLKSGKDFFDIEMIKSISKNLDSTLKNHVLYGGPN